jgi:outer membrane protein assembly factor BamB
MLAATAGHANDWPQWRGPDRNDVSKEKGLLKSWPKEGPKLLWTFTEAGTGYSGPAVVGDRMFLMGANASEQKETLVALDTKTGGKVWSTDVAELFSNGWGDGPRSTPTVDGDLVFVLTGNSELVCLDSATGNKRWNVNLVKDLNGKLMSGWGYSESPLVDGDLVVCTPGGSKGTMAALDKKTGSVRWRSKDIQDNAAYCSAVPATINGVRQYVQMTDKDVIGVAAADGRVLWRYKRPSGVATIPSPLVKDNLVYVTSAYRAGCNLLKITGDANDFKVEEVYADKGPNAMFNHHGGVVLVGDYLYGYSGGNEGKPNAWQCLELMTGKPAWEEFKKFEKGSLTCADGRLYLYGENTGAVGLIEASPKGWKEDGRFTIPQQTKVPRKNGHIWTHPVVANGKLFLRDQDLIFCYDVRDAGADGR